MSITVEQIPGYRAGTWTIDKVHSEVGFSIRHLAISKVKGSFGNFDATFVTGEPHRDGHLRTGDFFAAEEFPNLTFVSTGVRVEGGDFKVDGDLTMRGVTLPVTFDFEFGGFGEDPQGCYRAGFTATTVVKREDFGLSWNSTLEKGGFLLGSDVTITIDVQAELQA